MRVQTAPRIAVFAGIIAFAALSEAAAQEAAATFDELKLRTRIGQKLVVTGASGEVVNGRLEKLVDDELTLESNGTLRTFRAQEIALVEQPDPVWQGLVIGAAVGAGLATWDYLIDPGEPDNGVIYAVAIGLGAAVGAGIDALIGGSKTLFVARGAGRVALRIAPAVSRERRGAAVAVIF